jgi:hypothetical protein
MASRSGCSHIHTVKRFEVSTETILSLSGPNCILSTESGVEAS